MGTWLNAVIPPIAWATLIFILSSQPVLPSFDTTVIDFIFKKSSHMMVYGVLYILLHRGFLLITHKKLQPKAWWITWIMCFFYAITDEFHQSFVSNRTPSLYDIGYDMLGVFLAFSWIYRYI
jgi:VanZ family protein